SLFWISKLSAASTSVLHSERSPAISASAPTPVSKRRRSAMVLVLLAPQLFEPGIAPAIEAVEFVADGILHVVILMVLFGFVERAGRHDCGLDRLLEALLNRRLRGFRQRSLLLAMIEDRAAVLVAVIAELPILRQGIDVVPEHVEQLVIAHLGRVVDDLYRFGMPGAAVRDLLVAGIGGVPAGVARGGADHAVDLVEIGLHAPETAAGEGRSRGLLRLVPLPGGARKEADGEQQTEPNPSAGRVSACWAPHAVLPGLVSGWSLAVYRTFCHLRSRQFGSRSCDDGVNRGVAGKSFVLATWENVFNKETSRRTIVSQNRQIGSSPRFTNPHPGPKPSLSRLAMCWSRTSIIIKIYRDSVRPSSS